MSLIFSAERALEARLAAGLTVQSEAARKLGLARQALVNLENGDSVPGGKTLGLMAALYGVPVDFFFIESDRSEDAQAAPENCAHGARTPS